MLIMIDVDSQVIIIVNLLGFSSTDKCAQEGKICHANAQCVQIRSPSSQTPLFKCQCRYGFTGNGTWCRGSFELD